MSALGATVLAGGLARRMGGLDKGLVTLGGQPMVEHVLRAVQPAVEALVIVANRNGADYAAVGAPFGASVVADRHAGHLGPLAGLAAGIRALGTERVMLCPCDSPFVTAALAARLDAGCREEGIDIAVAHDGQRLQPVFCVVRREVLDSLEAFLDGGERKIDAWYAGESVREVDCRDLAAAFRNINTAEERDLAESALRSMGGRRA